MSIWPGAIASDANLYVAVDFPLSVTTLNGNINSSVTTIILTSAVNYPSSGGFIFIDSEIIYYAGVSGNQLTGCLRGQDGTLAASHLNGATVNLIVVAEHHNVLKNEIEAIETSLVLSSNTAVATNGSGLVTSSSTTATELGYVHGVTSAIQTQLNSKFTTAGTGLTGVGTTINLTVPVTPANGGTGQTTYTDGQLLIGNSSGNTLNVSTITGTTNQVIVTNGHGSITLSTPQNINTTSSPSFAGLTTTGIPGLSLRTGGTAVYYDNGNSNHVSISAPFSISSTYGLNWPSAQGGTNACLQNDGSGHLQWSQALGTTDSPTFYGTTIGAGGITLSGPINMSPQAISCGLITINYQNPIQFLDSINSVNVIQLSAPTNTTSSYDLFLPLAQATHGGQVLANDGSGNLSWTPVSGITTIIGANPITPDASLASTIIVTIGTATAINGPTNGYDGQKLTFRLVQDNAGHTVTFNTGSGNFEFSTDIPSFTASGANKVDYVTVIYNSARGKWDITYVVHGF